MKGLEEPDDFVEDIQVEVFFRMTLDTVSIPNLHHFILFGINGWLVQSWLKWTFALGCRYCLCNVGRETRKKPMLLHGKNGPWPHDFFASESEVAACNSYSGNYGTSLQSVDLSMMMAG